MKLNNREFEGWKEGLTIQDVIEINRFTYKRLVVKVNGKLIKKEEWSNFVLEENDDLKIHHLLAGG